MTVCLRVLSGCLVVLGLAGLMTSPTALAQDRGAIWSFTQSSAGGVAEAVSTLSFGVSQADAIAFDAVCRNSEPGTSVQVLLLIDHGQRQDGDAAPVKFLSAGFDATYAGTVSIVSSEYAGIRVDVGVDDPLWAVLAKNRRISFGVNGGDSVRVSLRRSAKPVQRFIAACRAHFAAFDAQSQPSAVDLKTYQYECEDGSTFQAQFDNSRSYSVAIIAPEGQPKIELKEAVSGSGARYSNGDIELHTKAETALLSQGDKLLRCRSN